MKIKEIDFKCIKILFEFRDKTIVINAEPYKTFSEIKQKALSKFSDVPNNIRFYYLGLDLTKNDEEKIGTIFHHKEQATVFLRLPILKCKARKNNISSSETNTPNNKKNLSYENIYTITLNNNSRNLNNLKSFKFPSLDKKKQYISKNISDNNTKFLKNNNKRKITNSLSMINQNLKHKINNVKIKKNKSKDILNDLDDLSYCENHKFKVSEYCRTCKKFFCSQCRLIQEHNNHLTIKLNPNNLEETIKLYIMLVITNEKRNLDVINNNVFSNGDKIINEKYLYKKKDSVAKQCDKMIENYNLFVKKIEKKNKAEKENYKTVVINTFNDIALKISRQISEILNKLDQLLATKGKKLPVNELQYFFDEISKKEETLEFIGDRIVTYLLSWEINTKIENTLNKIEDTLDEIINNENLFNLEQKYNKELSKFNINQINQDENHNIILKKSSKGILKKISKKNMNTSNA